MNELINFRSYNGNPTLKREGVKVNWTEDLLLEWMKCRDDPIYFAEKYIKIVHVDKGFIPIELYPYQKDIIEKITNHRRATVVTSRQAGKCVRGSINITVRNKKTGQVVSMPVEQYHELIRESQSKIHNEQNSRILSESDKCQISDSLEEK